jgi:molybdopterin converting factor small subunit
MTDADRAEPSHTAAPMTVTIRYFAGARAAAGCSEELVEVADGDTVADVLTGAADRHGDKLARVLTACSVLVDEVAARDHSIPLRPDAVLDVLPPFAGG